jgi:hypothetical protein
MQRHVFERYAGALVTMMTMNAILTKMYWTTLSVKKINGMRCLPKPDKMATALFSRHVECAFGTPPSNNTYIFACVMAFFHINRN